jgi:uncharacterized RDD family membrane protein YckC
MSTASPASNPTAGLWRRLAAMVYDLLLVIAVLMVCTALFLPFTGGEGVSLGVVGPVVYYFYRVLLLVLVVGYFGLFWTRRGQTLGMAAWRLRLERDDGCRLTWADALKRLAAACLSWLPVGLGYLWVLVDRDRLAWHDRLTHLRVVVELKQQ